MNILGVVDEDVLKELRAQNALLQLEISKVTTERDLVRATLVAEQNKQPESESFKLRRHAMDRIIGITQIDAVDKD
mgnify:FL=1